MKQPDDTPKHLRLAIALFAAICASLPGCEPREEPEAPEPVSVSQEKPSRWKLLENATVVSLPEDEPDAELEAAMTEARNTAPGQSELWLTARAEQQDRWAIKWAAPTAEDRVEYVWVRPLSWTQHRIEGILANTPQNELACAKTFGEPVSFPARQLADWIHFQTDNFDGPYEGGFTVSILSERFGESVKAEGQTAN